MEQSKRSRWKKFALVGCGCLLAFAVVVVVVVAVNWDKVSGFVSETAGVISELYTVQRAVEEHYPGPRVAVHLRQDSVEGDTLKVELVNPLFSGAELYGERAREKGREIAVVARDAAPKTKTYAHFEIEFKDQVGGWVRVSHGQTHRFEASELPPTAPR